MTKARAAILRKHHVPDTDIGRFELALLHVSTANAIPTLFWHLLFLLSSPTVLPLIRAELSTIITLTPSSPSSREGTINTSLFHTHCPLLVSSYRETIRLANSQAGSRRVIADTLLSSGDGAHRREFLLRAGADVQIPAGVPHLSSIWGPDAAEFDAGRFLEKDKDKDQKDGKEKAEDKEMKKSFFPFGGGKHLCPGRSFAFAEISGVCSGVGCGV
jgi:cytochrome P450